MNGMRLRAALWLVLVLLVLASGIRQFSGRLPLQSNLLALLPSTERNVSAEQAVARLADASGNRVVFLLSPADGAMTGKAVRAFAGALREAGVFRSVIADVPSLDPKPLLDFYRPYRFNLLAEADRGNLSGGTTDPESRLQRKLLSPFQVGLAFPLGDEPFGLADGWLAELPLRTLRLEPEDGLLVAREGARTWGFVSGELDGSAYDGELQRRVAAAVVLAENALHRQVADVEVLRTGTVFYAAAARQDAEREFDLIGAGSLIGMLLLLYLVFRSLRPLALGLLSVGTGIAAAVVVTVGVHGELHLITLVFGASLIGEAIDYAIQYFAAHLGAGAAWEPMSDLRRIAPGLTMALATSLLGYAALMLAPFPALSQIALFALSGLGAAWLTVFLLLPWLLQKPGRRDPNKAAALPEKMLAAWKSRGNRRVCFLAAAAVLALSFPGWLRVQGSDDVHLLVSRPAKLVAQEEKIRSLIGMAVSSQFFLVEADSPEVVLQREEALAERLTPLVSSGELTGFAAVSSFVPSRQRQAQNRQLWQERILADAPGVRRLLSDSGLCDEVVAEFFAAFRASEASSLTPEQWLASPFSMPYRHLWLGRNGNGSGNDSVSVVQLQGVRDVAALSAVAAGVPGVSLVDKAGSVSRLFGEYRQWGALWLAGAVALVYAVLCLRYGLRNAAAVVMPTLLAIGAAVGLIGYLGAPFTLFNLMGLMLVLGVGVNYAIFLREGGVNAPATLAGVMLSAGTTLLSFGLLSFSSMPALSGFGLTLLSGIGMAVLLAPMALSLIKAEVT